MSEEDKAFEVLWQEIKLNNHSNVLSLASKLPSSDQAVLKTQVIAHINLSNYSQALSLSQSSEDLLFETAYCHYKLGDYNSCLSICQNQKSQKFKQLKAQACFRSCLFEEAMADYEELLQAETDNTELLINLSASAVAPGIYERGVDHMLLQHSSTWEILFNKACALCGLQKFSEALSILESVESQIKKDSDLQDEIWMVKAQRAYIYQKTEEYQRASEIYQEILKGDSEGNLKAIAKNNLLALKKDESAEAIKQLKEAVAESAKLTTLQKIGILLNLAIIAHKRRRKEDLNNAINECQKWSVSDERLASVKSLVLLKEKKHQDYKDYLLSLNQPWAYILLSEIYLHQNKHLEASEALLALKEKDPSYCKIEYYITLCEVLEESKQLEVAASVLEEASKKFTDSRIWKLWAETHLKLGNPQKASEIYSEYLSNTYNQEFQAQLVLSEASQNISQAEKSAAQLPQVNLKALYSSGDRLESLDEILDRLEFANLTWKQKIEEKGPTEIKSKKRKRKPRYPKGIDPNDPNKPQPDPERWIPLKERKAFRKKYRKKQQKMKGPQGAAAEKEKEIGVFSRGPSTAHTEAVGEKAKKKRKK